MKQEQLTAAEPIQNFDEPLELGSVQNVADECDVSTCTVWRWVNKGIIPGPFRISPGCSKFDMKAMRRAIATRAA